MKKLDKIFYIGLGIVGTIDITISFVLAIMKDYPAATWYMLVGMGMVWLFDRKQRDEEKEREV